MLPWLHMLALFRKFSFLGCKLNGLLLVILWQTTIFTRTFFPWTEKKFTLMFECLLSFAGFHLVSCNFFFHSLLPCYRLLFFFHSLPCVLTNHYGRKIKLLFKNKIIQYNNLQPDYLVSFLGFFHMYDLGVSYTFHFGKKDFTIIFKPKMSL